MKPRNESIDILKGIGIVSIVIGHSCGNIGIIPLGKFVYSYHLMLFMFVIGYLIDINKFFYDKNYKFIIIGKQIIKMLSLYFAYNLFFVLLHNFFIYLHIIDSNFYQLKNIIYYTFLGISFNTNEVLLGALWFIPMMLFSKILFCILYNKVSSIINHIIMLISGILGYMLISHNIYLPYNIQISIIFISFIYIGILFKNYEYKMDRFITAWAFIPCALLMFIIILTTNYSINLSSNDIPNLVLFYSLALIGIFFCLSLTKLINKLNKLKYTFITLGKNSFHIMALHLLVIKLIDICYAYFNGIIDTNIITRFPYAFNLWYLYIILGSIVPILIILPFKKIKQIYINNIKTN